jgi:hypothetical protein
MAARARSYARAGFGGIWLRAQVGHERNERDEKQRAASIALTTM